MPKVKTSKEEVLQKVIPIIRERGVQHSSMSELAKACGIQKSHFYYYFSNKDQLIKEVLAVVHSYFKYNFFRITENKNTSLPKKVLEINLLIDKMFKTFDGGCIMANTALESAHLNPIYKEDIQLFFKDFISGVKVLLDHNYAPTVSQDLAEQIVQDLEGGILLMRIYSDSKYLNNAIARMKKIILKEQ